MEEKITVKSRTITRLQEWEGRLIGRVGEKIKRKCGGEDEREEGRKLLQGRVKKNSEMSVI